MFEFAPSGYLFFIVWDFTCCYIYKCLIRVYVITLGNPEALCVFDMFVIKPRNPEAGAGGPYGRSDRDMMLHL